MDILGPADVTMSQWNVIVIIHEADRIEKFLGYSHEQDGYRVSSQIESYDSEKNTGRTLSGSIYNFLDKPGLLHPLAQQLFEQLSALEGVYVSLKY